MNFSAQDHVKTKNLHFSSELFSSVLVFLSGTLISCLPHFYMFVFILFSFKKILHHLLSNVPTADGLTKSLVESVIHFPVFTFEQLVLI